MRKEDPVPLDPILEPIVAAMRDRPPVDPSIPAAERRRSVHQFMDQSFVALAEPGPEVAHTRDVPVTVDGGQITVRVYTPFGDGPFPGHLYIHGGGRWIGTLDHFDAPCREICAGVGCVVVSVDYRLAPEYQFPTAPEDCYRALQWVFTNAATLDIDRTRVSVSGASAGGNLTAVVAQMARDRGGPPLVFQLMEIPATDFTLSFPSMIENGELYGLTRASIEEMRDQYLPEPGLATHPYASPLLADDLTGLPPALVMTAEFDPLRDEGEAYGQRLQEAGVACDIRRWDGQFHGTQMFTRILPSAREYRDVIIDALRKVHGT
jgi:acetyl esterase